MQDKIQMELDLFEKSLFEYFWGSDWKSNGTYKTIMFMKGDMVQNYVNKFEGIMHQVMTEDGMVDSKRLRMIAGESLGQFANIIPETDFYLSDLTKHIGAFAERIMSRTAL